jgi:spore coat protein U-like protein
MRGLTTQTAKWQTLAAVFLAFATFPLTHAQNVPRPGVTANAIMPVTIEIVRSCIVSASDLDFGAYVSNSATPAIGQTTISLSCGAGVTVEISLDAGTSPGNNTSRRQMLLDTDNGRLDYDLFQDPGRTIHWGDRSGRDTLEVLTTDAVQTVPVYGEIPAGQRARDGTYSDMITITVHY